MVGYIGLNGAGKSSTIIFIDLMIGAWYNGYILYAGLYAVFFMISLQGWRMVLTGAVDLLSGNVIPLPFFPKKYLFSVELSPFAYMQNVPFFWLVTLMCMGIVIWKQAEKRIVIQGG